MLYVNVRLAYLKKIGLEPIINIVIIGLIILLIICQFKVKKRTNLDEKEVSKFPVILDTSTILTTKREATWLSTANYEIFYIGNWSDTIYPDYGLKYNFIPSPPPPPPFIDIEPKDTFGFHKSLTEHKFSPYYIDWLAPKNYKSWHLADLKISVDTTQRIKSDHIDIHSEDPFYEAYPVLIENKDVDTIRIAYGEFIPIIMEAKDSINNWRPIEKRWTYMCGNGVGTVILPPNQIVLSSAMKYSGNYPTTLRLRIDSTFSNEFKGNINYRQFESIFNKRGDFKEEYKQELANQHRVQKI